MSDPQSPLSFTVRHVESLTDGDLKAAELCLGKAFADDIFTYAVTNGDKEFYSTFWGTTVIAGSLGGEVYFAENDAKEVVGVAVWFGPGRAMYDSDDQKEKGLSVIMARLSPELRRWWGESFLPKHAELTTSLLGGVDKLAAWHLQTLATHPDYQRKGIATALINKIKEKAAKDRIPLCLEAATETNVGIYKRLGFVVTGEALLKALNCEFPMTFLIFETK